ncbi:CBP31, partial [Symbiodinium necroappetens]
MEVQSQLQYGNRSTLEKLAREAEALALDQEHAGPEEKAHERLARDSRTPVFASGPYRVNQDEHVSATDVETISGNLAAEDSSVKQTAGYISVNPITNYFFWLFEAKQTLASVNQVVEWAGHLRTSKFAENGPCKVAKNGEKTYANPSSWHNAANVMWVDQPAGVGFSTGIGTHDEKGVAENMYVFLQKFFQQFPQYQKTNFFVFGESYAGHYVPAISHRIWSSNKANEGLHIPLKGLAIGGTLRWATSVDSRREG